MNDPLIGREIDGYQIRTLLGRGGMARVYRAYDPKLNRYVAFKVIDPQSRDDTQYRERFRREARAVAQLRHQNIVGVHRFDDREGLYFMVMDYLEGADLRWILQEYRANGELMPHQRVLEIVTQVARGLDYAHKKGVIHRDIKPSNIMLTSHGEAVITDFGLALTASDETAGTTFGSAHYIAPEQAIHSGGAVPQSDLYSLGVTLFEMLTGDVPFKEGTSIQIAMAHVTEPLPPPQKINPTLSTAYNTVLEKVLAKEVTERYPNGEALVTALKVAVRQAKKEGSAGSSADIIDKVAKFQRENPLPDPQSQAQTSATIAAVAPAVKNKPRRRLLPVLLLLILLTLAGGVVVMHNLDLDGGTVATQPVTIMIKGIVRKIGKSQLTVYDLNLTLDDDIVQRIQVGDMVVLEGSYQTTAEGLHLTQLSSVSVNGEPLTE